MFPPMFDPAYPMIVLRGLARMIPGMRAYFDAADTLPVDGGYYCKAPDNRPLIGPLPVEGAYIRRGAVRLRRNGFAGGGENWSRAHVTGVSLPDYASSFSFDRFEGLSAADMADMRDATRGQL